MNGSHGLILKIFNKCHRAIEDSHLNLNLIVTYAMSLMCLGHNVEKVADAC